MDTLEIHVCTGVLINPWAVLIPASCNRPGFPLVRVKSSNLNGVGPSEQQEKLKVCQKIVHADFEGRTEGSNNIALLILGRNASTPVDMMPGLKALEDCAEKPQMYGWFAPTLNSGPSEDLKVVDMKPVKRTECEDKFPGLSSGSVCLETDLAQGMTWSPGAVLTCKSTDVIGMMTHTLPGSRPDLGPSPNTRLPYVFTSAWEHREWIKALGGKRSEVLYNELDDECQNIETGVCKVNADGTESCKATADVPSD
ncbi:unnamed protein product [Ostreobium quekettii]|uniref:Peptidase S1 domain-containing protein n=1 Tax=Ostreobium quekettii TaxID=121088 RepID=A0A8S1J173_9CHLO|nr:unnamed protein product [Ostreobium quekettii]